MYNDTFNRQITVVNRKHRVALILNRCNGNCHTPTVAMDAKTPATYNGNVACNLSNGPNSSAPDASPRDPSRGKSRTRSWLGSVAFRRYPSCLARSSRSRGQPQDQNIRSSVTTPPGEQRDEDVNVETIDKAFINVSKTSGATGWQNDSV